VEHEYDLFHGRIEKCLLDEYIGASHVTGSVGKATLNKAFCQIEKDTGTKSG
jgi:hypothetical protein